ncbi:MAG: hypothetical protein ACKO5F_07555 [Synechococcus sp.]
MVEPSLRAKAAWRRMRCRLPLLAQLLAQVLALLLALGPALLAGLPPLRAAEPMRAHS